jgi:hypothetical protein
MISITPFAANRFEFEGKHLYYLPVEVFRPLEEPVPAYLIGTRGTGKTTLLKALNWERRLRDEHLRSQLGDDPFAGRYIGVYLKIPRSTSISSTVGRRTTNRGENRLTPSSLSCSGRS